MENIKIFTSNQYNKEAINLHKLFYYTNKILPIFKEISIKNIYKNNKLIINKFILNKENFYIKAPSSLATGTFKINKNYTNIYFNTIIYKNITLQNTHLFSFYTKKYIFANIKTHFQNNLIYLALKLEKNFINYSLLSNNLNINYKNNNISTKKINIIGTGNISNFLNLKAKYILNSVVLKNNKLTFYSKKISGNLYKNFLFVNSHSAKIYYPKIFKLLKLVDVNIIFDLKNNSLMSQTKQSSLLYKKFKLYAKNIQFNYNLNDKTFFLHAVKFRINNDIQAKSSEIIISKLPELYLFLKNNDVSSKYFILKNKTVKGNKKIVLLSEITGKLLSFPIKTSYIDINLKNKTVSTKKLNYNNINFYDIKLFFNKKPYILSAYTKTLLDKNVLNILKKYNINISFLQKKGQNILKFKIFFTKHLTNINYYLNSLNSTFLYKDINFKYSSLKAKGDINLSKILVKNLFFKYKYITNEIDSNITINIPKKYINSFVFIKKFDIDNYLNIKNFKEKIVIDLNKKNIYMLNSYIFINLKTKTIYLFYLKKLLKYSILNEIFENGKILIKLLKNEIDIFANTYIKYPLFLNQKNPNEINAKFILKNNNLYIKNEHINTQIVGYKKIYSHLNNVDINIESLIKIINTIEKVINKTKHKTTIAKNKKQNNLEIFINSNNTNFIYKNHKFLTQTADLYYNKEINFSAKYKKSTLTGYTKNKFLLIEGKNYDKQTLVPLLNFFNHFTYINLDFILVRSPENFYTGKIYIKKGAIKDLGALNNIIAFINTIPTLLTLNTPGFSAKGYKIKKGYINYLFYNDILYFKQITIKGINLDFYGKGYVDLKKNYIKMKIHTVIKIKLKKIPILGKALSYILFGKDGYLHVNIFVKGDLNNPKISKDMGGGIIESPVKLFKRIITLPFNIF